MGKLVSMLLAFAGLGGAAWVSIAATHNAVIAATLSPWPFLVGGLWGLFQWAMIDARASRVPEIERRRATIEARAQKRAARAGQEPTAAALWEHRVALSIEEHVLTIGGVEEAVQWISENPDAPEASRIGPLLLRYLDGMLTAVSAASDPVDSELIFVDERMTAGEASARVIEASRRLVAVQKEKQVPDRSTP